MQTKKKPGGPAKSKNQPDNLDALRRQRIRIIQSTWKRVVARYTGATE